MSHFETTSGADERSNNKLLFKRRANTKISTESSVISQIHNQGPVKEYDDFFETIDTGNGSPQETCVLSSHIESLQIEVVNLCYICCDCSCFSISVSNIMLDEHIFATEMITERYPQLIM